MWITKLLSNSVCKGTQNVLLQQENNQRYSFNPPVESPVSSSLATAVHVE